MLARSLPPSTYAFYPLGQRNISGNFLRISCTRRVKCSSLAQRRGLMRELEVRAHLRTGDILRYPAHSFHYSAQRWICPAQSSLIPANICHSLLPALFRASERHPNWPSWPRVLAPGKRASDIYIIRLSR